MEAARLANADDVSVLVQLAEDAAAELRPQRGGSVFLRRENHRLPPESTFLASLDDPAQLVVVGCVHDAVVGYGVVRLEVLHDGERLAVVDDIFVDRQARGIGVGESIMDQLVAWATEHGAIGIDSIALPGMRDTKNFFETFGLVARAIVVHRPLPGPAAADTAEP